LEFDEENEQRRRYSMVIGLLLMLSILKFKFGLLMVEKMLALKESWWFGISPEGLEL
jgi:hypothetical protein